MAQVTPEALTHARVLWDYLRLGQPLARADAIFVLCSHDLRVGAYAADLYLAGWAPLLIFSGGLGNFTAGRFTRPEAELFADVARARGVPESALLLEPCSRNCGENVRFTRALLAQRGLAPRHLLLVQKPFMERRALATVNRGWPEVEATVTSPPLALEEFPTPDFSLEYLVHVLAGDFQRVLVYPALGYQTPQEVPPAAMAAWHALVALGFTGHLVPAS